jgi:apolipoprotein N-acyltransferase
VDYSQLTGPMVPGGWPEPERGAFIASDEHPACLIAWPESCLPRQLDTPLVSFLPAEVNALLSPQESAGLLLGAMGRPHSREDLENGAVLLTSPGPEARWVYSKVRVVPFGELLPFRGAIRFLEYPWSSQDVSEGRRVELFTFAGQQLSVQICFDNVWGFVSRRAVLDGASALLLLTNNSWYDLPSGIRQHCDMDRLRAIETRRTLGRVSTTGWSHIIHPSGRISASSSGLNVQETVEDWLPLNSGLTPYCRLGDVFAQFCLLAAVLLCLRVVLPGRSECLL